ncbi:uncharacterized protein mcf2lb isoform X1 [Ictalurus punctatus]|uniref:DNA-directed DNA polymerase n=1 Tax=Ictalurus punctatus TaxID=7998 RepID=A0A9F7RK55_ICTPU|nr:uncharacterized protein mcf2lb isoform X1 [Ictalurus punctatus]
MQINPCLIDVVNQINENMSLSPVQNIVSTPENAQEPRPLCSHDMIHELNQSLMRINDGLVNLIENPDNIAQNSENDNERNRPMENIHSPNTQDSQMENIHSPDTQDSQMENSPDIQVEQEGDGLDPNIRIINPERFNNTEIRRRVNFSSIANVDSFADFYNYVLEILNSAIEIANNLISAKDVVTVEIRGDTINVSSRVQLDNGVIDLGSFLTMLENAIQSKREIFTDNTLELVVQIVRPPRGGGIRRKIDHIFKTETLQKKMQHLYIFHNRDNMCFALCVSQLLNREKNDFETEQIARKLQHDVGLSVNTAVSFADVPRFERHLNCKIVIVHCSASKAGYSFFQTSKTPHEKTIYLFLHDNHYYGVKSITGLLGTSHVCHFCHSGFDVLWKHKCAYSCNVCHYPDCYKHPKNVTKCPECQRLCSSQYCFEMHKAKIQSHKGKYSMCETGFYCGKCKRVIRDKPSNRENHVCAHLKCIFCGQKLDEDIEHRCFIQRARKESENTDYVFYDFETRQETGTHVANFICCIDFKGEEWVAEGDDCVSAFFKKFRCNAYHGYKFIAHNARGFDSYLLLNHLVKEGITPEIIAQGGKILCFIDTAFRQSYIDSLSFLPMKLSSIPKAMGFSESKKGYFPHFWNTVEHQDYVGPYPDPKFYGVDGMMPKDREEFFKWYRTVSDKVFDFKKEMAEYCVNDVEILRKGCIAFRQEILDSTKVDPFKCITIASVCMKIFRTNFLRKDTLAIPPLDNYIATQKSFSTPSIQWLEYVSKTQNLPIRHALNEGEVRFGTYYVDGYCEEGENRKVFEFLGCFYHGCEKCFPSMTPHPLTKSNATFGDIRQKSMERIKNLQDTLNLQVTLMWEHEWNEMKKNDNLVQNFLKDFDFPERLNPRDALYGGRTNALNLHYVAQPGERIDYFDFTSLYPFVNKTKTYPIDHPIIIYRDFQPLKYYFGIIRAKVLPPRGLWAPVLPFRVKSKLLFPLCRTCAEHQLKHCDHTAQERALTGTWASIEIEKAVEKGYKILKVFEVWHFPKRSDKLFTRYIKMFLKTKQESSGYPAWVVDESSKREYIRKYKENEGITLDPKFITVNPAKRSVAKLALNSLWGKMCQRPDRSNTTLIRDPAKFLQFMFSDIYNVSQFSFLNEEVVMVQWRYADERLIKPLNANVFIGIFTTAYARLELYNLMDRLDQRCLYTDTDSVIFKSKEGDWMPPLSDYLGGLTSELDDGDQIVEFVSAGPKTYGYKTMKGKTTMKAKGITLNCINSEIVNLKSLTELVDERVKNPDHTGHLVTTHNQIVRDKKGFHLRNKSQLKRFRVVYDKRVLLSDFTTLPYGY